MMQWYNEPESWQSDNRESLTLWATAKSDYWQKTHYGFTVDDGPFYYTEIGGDFEVSVKITGAYQHRYDQMGLMFRTNDKNWIKTGIEYVDQTQKFSTVVTHQFSSWSVTPLDGNPKSIWINAKRIGDAVEIYYSLDGEVFEMASISYLSEGPVKVGMMAASPDGEGFKAIFENFKIKQLPNQQRLNWLQHNQKS